MTDGPGSTILEGALGWFPLIQRPRPPSLPLEIRIGRLRDMASRIGGVDREIRAAEVLNHSALIASDCGLPELARTLCWRQHEIFSEARPLAALTAELALQPVLNLSRQMIREGDGDGAYAMLQDLYRAARRRTDVVIDGRPVHLRDMTRTPNDHRAVCTLIWAALLADGTRALAQTGRWREAAQHAAAHRGVGLRLLDGRQTTILAFAQDGKVEQAATLIEQSATSEPWERAVQGLLRIHCLWASGLDASPHTESMITVVLAVLRQPDPSTAVFQARAGMIALGLADAHTDLQLDSLRATLFKSALSDAYAARDVLGYMPLSEDMSAKNHRALTSLVEASGLGAGTIPQPLYSSLEAISSSVENQLREALGSLRR